MDTHDTAPRPSLSRRSILKAGLAVAGGATLAGCATSRGSAASASITGGAPRRRTFRFAHLTDVHMMPERNAEAGVARAFNAVNSLADRPGLIITGGDSCHLGMSRTREQMKWMYDRLAAAWKNENAIPLEHTIGNHDIWGWEHSRSGASPSDPGYGKAWALDAFGIASPCRSFDRGGWRFVILDSVQVLGEGYLGRLDPLDQGDQPQFEWLKATLAATPADMPVVVVSHIPILSGPTLLTDGRWLGADGREGYRFPQGSMMVDAPRLVDLFTRHPNVKLCLSGHIHINDRNEFNGVTYICSGAGSGCWWIGRDADLRNRQNRRRPGEPEVFARAREGFLAVDLFSDGTFETAYQTFAWTPLGT